LSVPTASPMSLIFGMLGVMGFSLTLPMTRMAIVDLSPTFVGVGKGYCCCRYCLRFLLGREGTKSCRSTVAQVGCDLSWRCDWIPVVVDMGA
jgi:hypothetical protein